MKKRRIVDLLARFVNTAEDSDFGSDADLPEFIQLLTTEQMRNYAFSNPDLEKAFIRVVEALDSSEGMSRQASDFVIEVARIAHKPRPKSLREGIDLLKELVLEARRDPKLMGNLLLAEWITGKFLSDAVELSGELKPEISELAKEWLRLWWLYLFRARVAMRYGNDVMSKMMDHVRQNLRKLAEIDLNHNFRGLSEKIDTVVGGLDTVLLKFKAASVLAAKGKVPEEYIAAAFFLVLDLESPYRKSGIDEDVVTEVSLTFVTMRARVTEWIDSVI
jgi:hypothetical protein